MVPQFQSTNEAMCYGLSVNGDVKVISEMKLKLSMLDRCLEITRELRLCDTHTMKTMFNRQVLRESIEMAEGKTEVNYLRYLPKEVLFFDFN